MPKFILVAFSNPANGVRDEDVASWYDNTHVPEIRTAIPSVGDVRRYLAASSQPTPDGTAAHRYLTTYEIEANDAAHIVDALARGHADGIITAGTVLDVSSAPPVLGLYQIAD
jgi:hypothetical protein